jgi:CBS domain-containing protein
MKNVKELLQSKPVHCVKSGMSVLEAAKYMGDHNIGLVPVLGDDGKLLGVFSERDLVRRVIAKDLDLGNRKVDEVMTKELILGNLEETHKACLQKMKKAKIRHILIVDNDKLAGVVSIRDLLEIDITTHKETIEVLHNYIYSK